jgi:hypothetical protein
METMVLTGIGGAALSYAFYAAWCATRGKTGCGCGNGGSCRKAGGSCGCSSRNLPK